MYTNLHIPIKTLISVKNTCLIIWNTKKFKYNPPSIKNTPRNDKAHANAQTRYFDQAMTNITKTDLSHA